MRSVHRLCVDVLGASGIELTLQLAFATGDDVIARAPKQVTSAGTLDFTTLMPEPGGLFDHRVFGPGTVIDAPPIDDDQIVTPRKTQFARITLARPIVHPLVCAHAPAELAGRAGTSLDAVALWKRGESPEAYAAIIAGLELGGHGALVMRELPVLPPDLRPLRRLDDDRWAVSALNDLYHRILARNEQLGRLVERGAPEAILVAETRHLHDSVLMLFDGETSLHDVCGRSVIAEGLRELDRSSPSAAFTGRAYRAAAQVFALGMVMQGRGE